MTRRNKLNAAITIVCLGLSVFLLMMVYGNLARVNAQKQKIEELTAEKAELELKKESLQEEVEKLNDPDYAARYARDHYIFPGDGEEVIRLPEIKE